MTNGHDLGHLRSTASERKLQREKEQTVDLPASPPVANTAAATKPTIPMPALLLAMLHVSNRVSDLIFSPGSLPHVEVSGELVPVKIPGLQILAPEDTRRIADELIGGNKQALAALQEQ